MLTSSQKVRPSRACVRVKLSGLKGAHQFGCKTLATNPPNCLVWNSKNRRQASDSPKSKVQSPSPRLVSAVRRRRALGLGTLDLTSCREILEHLVHLVPRHPDMINRRTNVAYCEPQRKHSVELSVR